MPKASELYKDYRNHVFVVLKFKISQFCLLSLWRRLTVTWPHTEVCAEVGGHC